MGKQINFYLTEEDIKEVESYIKYNEILILGSPMKTSDLKKLDSLVDSNFSFLKFLSKKELEEQIKIKYIETQHYYLVDSLKSPVLEFSQPKTENKNIQRRGRIYYSNDIQNKIFLKFADDFFKWFRKTFKNVKLKNYTDIHISPRTLEWLDASQSHKLEDFPEVIQTNKEKRKQKVA